jgi:hypothetical protein
MGPQATFRDLNGGIHPAAREGLKWILRPDGYEYLYQPPCNFRAIT